jgi:hypothetical protein
MDIEKISNVGVKPKKVYSVVECSIVPGDYTVPGEIGWAPRLKEKGIYPGGNLKCLIHKK